MVDGADAVAELVWGAIELVAEWLTDSGAKRRDDPPFRYPESLYHQRPPQDLN